MENEISKPGKVLIQQSQNGQYPASPGQGEPGSDLNLNNIPNQSGVWQITNTFWSDTGGNYKRYIYTVFQKISL